MDEVVRTPTLTEYRTGISLPDAVELRLAADNGTTFAVRIRRGQVAPLIVDILGRADGLPPEENRREFDAASLTAIGAEAVVDSDGRPGISIRLAGELRLTLSLTRSSIVNLQDELAIAMRFLQSPAAFLQ